MGCTPSHSDIINSVAKSGIQFFKKPRAVLPGGQGTGERGAVPVLDRSSSCYDSGGVLSPGQRPTEGPPGPRGAQTWAEGHGQLTGEPTEDLEGRIPETKTAPPRLNTAPSRMAQDTPFQTRSSRESWGEESTAPGPSLWEQRSRLPRSGQQEFHCQTTTLPAQGSEGQVDFPDGLVKAHRRAYTYLHSCLARYEAVLSLTHQAARTQELLRPMVRFLQLCFEEAHGLLGEISGDGEALLREVGGDLAWPSRKGEPQEQPDLLQQLLQYTVSRLQGLAGTVASLTDGCLQGCGGHLQTAASHLGSQLSAKRRVDERLLRTLGQLESLGSGPGDPGGQGHPLCSEDSGIGADSEPGHQGDRLGGQASWDLTPEPGIPPTAEAGLGGPPWQPNPFWRGSDRPQDFPLSGPPAAQVQPAAQVGAGSRGPSSAGPESAPCRPAGLGKGKLCDSFGAWASVEAHLPQGCGLGSTPSLGAGGDSSTEEREDSPHPRSPSSPAGPESLGQLQARGLRSPREREMIRKMKEAISDRIKFVPVASGPPDWAEEEEERTVVPPRPSTVHGSRRGPPRQRRARSEAGLKSHGEGLSLQELRRVQGELSRRLEAFYALGTRGRAAPLRPDPPGRGAPGSTIGRLKASLTQSCSILPSQDKSIPQKRRPGLEETGQLPEATPPGERAGEAARAQDGAGRDHPPRTSVKKLIATFSPAESLQTPGESQDSGPGPGLRKWGVPILPPRFPIYRGLAPLYPKPQISPAAGPGWRPFAPLFPPLPAASPKEDLPWEVEDPEHLPPPPLEILMDKSFISLEPPESSTLAGSVPGGTHVPGRGEAGSARRTWAPSKLGASIGPADLLPSRHAATPAGPGSSGLGGGRSGCNRGKLAVDPNIPPATRRNPEAEDGGAQGRARADRAVSVSKLPWRAAPWHPSGQHRTSEPGLPRPTRGPHSSEAPGQSPESSSPRGRRASPPRAPGAPRADRRPPSLSSPPRPAQPRVPLVHGSPSSSVSPPASPRALSPSTTGTPPQHKLPSPPPESPLAQHGIFQPPAQRTEARSPASGPSPLPPVCAPRGPKETRGPAASEAATASASASGSTCPELCPASSESSEANSPFAAAHPLPPALPPAAGGPRETPPGCCGRSSSGPRQRGGSQRGMTLCALHPQPFVRRTASDQPPAPGATSHACDSQRGQSSSSEESPKKDTEPWSGPCAPELKGGRAASPPELCVLGHGLHREASAGRTQDKPQRKEVA